jgi:translation initiation factor IF-2
MGSRHPAGWVIAPMCRPAPARHDGAMRGRQGPAPHLRGARNADAEPRHRRAAAAGSPPGVRGSRDRAGRGARRRSLGPRIRGRYGRGGVAGPGGRGPGRPGGLAGPPAVRSRAPAARPGQQPGGHAGRVPRPALARPRPAPAGPARPFRRAGAGGRADPGGRRRTRRAGLPRDVRRAGPPHSLCHPPRGRRRGAHGQHGTASSRQRAADQVPGRAPAFRRRPASRTGTEPWTRG